jgi:CelD/BcsL family acetyltransferase involved in cellulose biosynthesis
VIAVGYGTDGQALFLWPFETATIAGLPVLKWLGQAHANYNMGLFQPETLARFGESDMTRLLREVAREAGVVAAVLEKQPFARNGVTNPFANLPHRAAPNSGYAVSLGTFQTLYQEQFSKRSRDALKRKERNLAAAGALSYGWAETREEKFALLETFFAQKARQFAYMGVAGILDVHTRAFYREVALLEGDNPSRLRLGYLKVGDAVLATFNVTLCHGRMEVALSSLADGELQRYSPGALLLKHQIEEACVAGLSVYDLGTGAARHKEEWCDVVVPLFDSFIAFKPHGALLTLALASKARAKRFIKSNPRVYEVAKKMRRVLRRNQAAPD